MQPIGIQHMNSRKCSPNARKSIAFEKNLFWVRNELLARFSCYSRSYAHDHSSLKIKNPPVGFRSNPSSIFISPARSNVFRLFKQMSVSKDGKIKKKEHLTIHRSSPRRQETNHDIKRKRNETKNHDL